VDWGGVDGDTRRGGGLASRGRDGGVRGGNNLLLIDEVMQGIRQTGRGTCGHEIVGGDSGPVWRRRGPMAARSALDIAVGTHTMWPLAGLLLEWALGRYTWWPILFIEAGRLSSFSKFQVSPIIHTDSNL
jgi:hypothetical protein